jgi:hypothetical protein
MEKPMLHRLTTITAATLFVLCLGMGSAWACTVPNVFVNNTIADADQMDANFAAVLACINVNSVVGPNSSTLHNVACFGNTAGSLLEACATIPAAQLPAPGSVSGGVANPIGTTSNATLVMMGIGSGCAFTPNRSGKALLIISGDAQNSGTGGFSYRIQYGTGAAPANATALTGSAASATSTNIPPAGIAVPFSTQGVVTGLTLGTAYWFDLGLAMIVSGTASVTNLTCSALES